MPADAIAINSIVRCCDRGHHDQFHEVSVVTAWAAMQDRMRS